MRHIKYKNFLIIRMLYENISFEEIKSSNDATAYK